MFSEYSHGGVFFADLLKLIPVLFIILLIINIVRGRTPALIYGRWGHLIDNLTFSSDDFYKRVEAVIKSKEIKDVHISRVNLYQGAPLVSATRVYLRVTWQHKAFDICAAPLGKGFTISWWCFEQRRWWQILLSAIPLIGKLLLLLFRRTFTYYRVDMGAAFASYIHQAVEEVMDEITKDKALRPLSELQRQPKYNALLDIV